MRFTLPKVFLTILFALFLPMSALAQGGEAPARLLVADFSSQPEDAGTASALSEAFRNGLGDFDMVQLLASDELQMTLETMRLPATARLDETVAMEAAIRRGVPLVVTGDLKPSGTGYQLAIRLIDPVDGTVHLSMEEGASSAEEALEAVGGMVSTLCDQMAEVLPSVSNRPRLPAVTTSSLEALQALAEARALNSQRNYPEALPLVEDAVEKDPSFAEAWRFLGIVLNNLGQDRDRRIEAFTRAYELSEDIPEPERLNITASYYTSANIDSKRAVEVLELIGERYPNRAQWNNLGVYYPSIGEFEKARDALKKAVDQGVSNLTTANLIGAALRINDMETARATLTASGGTGYWPCRQPELRGDHRLSLRRQGRGSSVESRRGRRGDDPGGQGNRPSTGRISRRDRGARGLIPTAHGRGQRTLDGGWIGKHRFCQPPHSCLLRRHCPRTAGGSYIPCRRGAVGSHLRYPEPYPLPSRRYGLPGDARQGTGGSCGMGNGNPGGASSSVHRRHPSGQWDDSLGGESNFGGSWGTPGGGPDQLWQSFQRGRVGVGLRRSRDARLGSRRVSPIPRGAQHKPCGFRRDIPCPGLRAPGPTPRSARRG